jgi:arylsulfatase
MIRWPGHVKPGTVSNDMVSGLDWFPTLLAAAGDATIKDRLLKGWAAQQGGMTYKVHLDGFNLLPYLEGKEEHSPRHEFYYFNDDADLVAVRFDNWKIVFCEQRQPGGFQVWANPFTCLRVPKAYNLRMDPYERADIVSDQYYDFFTKNAYVMQWAMYKVQPFLQSLKEYPPSQRVGTFSIDQMMESLTRSIGSMQK